MNAVIPVKFVETADKIDTGRDPEEARDLGASLAHAVEVWLDSPAGRRFFLGAKNSRVRIGFLVGIEVNTDPNGMIERTAAIAHEVQRAPMAAEGPDQIM